MHTVQPTNQREDAKYQTIFTCKIKELIIHFSAEKCELILALEFDLTPEMFSMAIILGRIANPMISLQKSSKFVVSAESEMKSTILT